VTFFGSIRDRDLPLSQDEAIRLKPDVRKSNSYSFDPKIYQREESVTIKLYYLNKNSYQSFPTVLNSIISKPHHTLNLTPPRTIDRLVGLVGACP
jgi:hypothetical protein